MNGISNSITENNVFGWTEIRSHKIWQKYITFISAYLLKCSSWSSSSWTGSYLSVCQVQGCPICRWVAYNHVCGSYAINVMHLFRQLCYELLWYLHRQLTNQPTIMVVASWQKRWTFSNLHTVTKRQQVPLKYGKSPLQTTCSSFLEDLILIIYAMETSNILCKLLSDSGSA